MRAPLRSRSQIVAALTCLYVLAASLTTGCRTAPPTRGLSDLALRDAIERYAARRSDDLAVTTPPASALNLAHWASNPARPARPRALAAPWPPPPRFDAGVFTLGMFAQEQPATAPAETPTTGPAAFVPPEGYWRRNIWHQMGYEARQLGTRDLWRGFKTSYWDIKNVALLSLAMGASITIRETGVDGTIRNRTHGSNTLGDMDETVQILGNPGTHFAATGVLWLGSALTEKVREHEVAKALTQALAVNGISTMLLKVSTNTTAPNGDDLAWPSGHTSSSFTVAAVLNEYYGPWVGLPAFGLAGLVGFQRLDSRTHDFSDVVFGAMLGYVIGSSIAKDDKAHFPELFGMQVVPYMDPTSGTSGIALMKQW
ncbi:MAG: phosphatase PAP2 family protein [Planctomycetota bacterium]